MRLESARHRARLWLPQAGDDLRAEQLPQRGQQAAQACFLAQQVGEKASKALLALLRELDDLSAERWRRQARVLDKLYAPTRYPNALGDDLPAELFGPEDASAAHAAATELLGWASDQLQRGDCLTGA